MTLTTGLIVGNIEGAVQQHKIIHSAPVYFPAGVGTGVHQVTSSRMICSFKGRKKESISSEARSVLIVVMFIKYFFHPRTVREDPGEREQ